MGKTGTGKTTLAKKLIEKKERLLIFDPLQEYSGSIFSTFESLCDYFLDSSRQVERKKFRVVCRFETDIEPEFLFRLAWELRDVTILVEEASLFLSPRTPTFFHNLINQGRHRNVSIIAVVRRAPELSIQFRAMCTSVITFEQTEPRDLDHLENLGFEFNDEKFDQFEYKIWGEPIFDIFPKK